ASDALVAIAAIISAVCAGELTPQEGILLTRMIEAFLRVTQKVAKFARKPERPGAVATMREADGAAAPMRAEVSRAGEAPSPTPGMVQAHAPRRPGEGGLHSPPAEALHILAQQPPARSLSRLPQEALRSTS